MATPPRIDVETLLLPIAISVEPDPRLERDAVQFQFRQMLRAADSAQMVPNRDEARRALLDELIELGKTYIERKSKDLVVAAWMAEALTQNDGFAGLRDGLRLMHGLISRCWDDCHPPLGRGGDADLRSRSFEALASDRYLLLGLRRVPLADGESGAEPFCYLDLVQGPAGRRPAPTEAEVSSGPVFEAVSRSPRVFYERIAADLREAIVADQALGVEVVKRFQADAPDLRPVSRALAECQRFLEVILAVKRRQSPDEPARTPDGPEPSPTVITGTTSATGGVVDYGRVLIDFLDRARTLADAAARLKENREKHASLRQEMEKLDAEYAEITDRIARDAAYEPLLSRRLAPPREGGPGD